MITKLSTDGRKDERWEECAALLLFEYSNLHQKRFRVTTRLHLSIDCELRLLEFLTNFSWASFINILWATNLEFFPFICLKKRKIIFEWSSLLTRNSNYPHPISEKLRGDARQHNFEWYQQKKKIPAGEKACVTVIFQELRRIINVFASHIKKFLIW